jgi:AcrR family transcriptional regulator
MPRKNKQAEKPPRRGRGRPRVEDTAGIESKLLDVALQEFVEKGYGAASVSNMVRKAGMSKTTVYSRFSSKADLFRAIMMQQVEKVSPESLLSPLEGKVNLEQGLAGYARHSLTVSLEADSLAVNRLMYSESSRFPELAEAATERSRQGIARIAAFIRECAKQDGLTCRDPERVAQVFILMNRGWYVDVMLSNRKVSGRDLDAWVDASLHTLLASREHW